MIQALVTMLCGVGVLVCIFRQQKIIQIQSEQLRRHREVLALRDEQLSVYEELHREQGKQIKLLKEYAAMLKK